MKTLGVVLSGGGTRGVAHVGVLQVLQEAGIRVDRYAGTSAGALVGVLAAAGSSINEMLDFWLDSNPFAFRNMAPFRKPGLFESRRYVGLLRRFVRQERFEELETPLTVAVTAMLRGEVEYVSRGPLWPIVVASAAFPMVFSPVEVGDERYMDGGIIDNLPVAPIHKRCDVILGINVSPRRQPEPSALARQFGVLERVVDLTFRAQAGAAERDVDVLVVPEGIGSVSTFDRNGGLEVYESGVDAGRKMLPTLRAALQGSESVSSDIDSP